MRAPTHHHHGPRDHDHGGNAIHDRDNCTVQLHDGAIYAYVDEQLLTGDDRTAALERVRAAIAAELDDPGDGHGADPARLLPGHGSVPDRRDGDQLDELRAAFIDALARTWLALDDDGDIPRAVLDPVGALVAALDAAGDRSGD